VRPASSSPCSPVSSVRAPARLHVLPLCSIEESWNCHHLFWVCVICKHGGKTKAMIGVAQKPCIANFEPASPPATRGINFGIWARNSAARWGCCHRREISETLMTTIVALQSILVRGRCKIRILWQQTQQMRLFKRNCKYATSIKMATRPKTPCCLLFIPPPECIAPTLYRVLACVRGPTIS
jgi:hypothetical protein